MFKGPQGMSLAGNAIAATATAAAADAATSAATAAAVVVVRSYCCCQMLFWDSQGDLPLLPWEVPYRL